MRFIPRKTKVKMEFIKGITLADIIIGFIGAIIGILIVVSNFELKFIYAISWVSIMVTLFMPVTEDLRIYSTTVLLFKYSAYKKKYSKKETAKFESIRTLIPYKSIDEMKYIRYNDYFASVIEIKPREFNLLTLDQQNILIEEFSNVIKALESHQNASIIKINKPQLFDDYIQNEDRKYETVLSMAEEGQIDKAELSKRSMVFENRVTMLNNLNSRERIFKDHFYIVVYDKYKESLDNTIQEMCETLERKARMDYKLLREKDIAVFMKANYTRDFNERQLEGMEMDKVIEWTMPDIVEFKMNRTVVDGKDYKSFTITDYPINVANAWAYNLFKMEGSKVVVNIKPHKPYDAEKLIDKALMEMQAKSMRDVKESVAIDNETHMKTLRDLLIHLKTGNEILFDFNMHISCELEYVKSVRAQLRQEGFKFTELFGRQVESFISQNISRRDTLNSFKRGIHGESVSAMFPFISRELMDTGGFYVGNNATGPVFIDFFQRDSNRVNSNMMIIGKSGGGKSFATKTLLANLAADNSKIFILDPENEYEILTKNLNGQILDVGTGMQGRINPFHITPSLKGEEMTDVDDYSSHLQFLEQYFRTILIGIESDAFEKVNSLVVDLYSRKGIKKETDVEKLKPEDFPIFDDLYDLILEKIENETDSYIKRMYQIMETYVQKFSSSGRNSNLWNGPTTLETKENLVTFSFRSLLANNNMIIANAQMLLVLRFLNNEIIKNKEFNIKYKFGEKDPARRKVVVAVDEAHTFINKDYPVALNFMEQMAKRIRKYSGMQIIITQNVKDFVGSPEIAKQSSAIINASQYSMMFGLAPNDMSDIVELYRNAGGLNEDEQRSIARAGLGEAFVITSPLNRTELRIIALNPVRDLFEKLNKKNA